MTSDYFATETLVLQACDAFEDEKYPSLRAAALALNRGFKQLGYGLRAWRYPVDSIWTRIFPHQV
jgi:hypothetical protein